MGSYTLTVFALFLSVAALIIHPSLQISHEILGKVCSKVEDEDFCLRFLENDPRTRSADLPKLSLISIELTKKRAQATLQTFIECVIEYKNIQRKIEMVYQLSQQKKYKKITQLAKAWVLANTCNSINSILINKISHPMFLTLDAANGVNKYITQMINRT
ncbi:hypothetical protein RGQ29_013856 [Quercus rubra]|uniref:Pectinesterase inhibitor domain-containing protein n=1 Tax=Quercus rubra TaxID=3512 RepID=A0AAN7FKP5_QUERU|nr:hypothetical protein RGQ29_013856 [Quercus rubra]